MEAAVSQPLPDQPVENDPLLAFSSEPGASSPMAAAPLVPQAPANVEVPPAAPVEPARDEPIAALLARVDRLERSLDQSVSQVAKLKSEVATLVGTVDDIKRRLSRRPANMPLPVATRVARPRPRFASAVAGIMLGTAVGAWGWTTWTQDSIDAIQSTHAAAAAAVPVQVSPQPEPVPPPVAATVAVTPLPPPPRDVSARAVPSVIKASAPIDYVGTLSIDAAPGGEVFIDRQTAGRTPLRAANLKAGSHLIWIERDGYRRFTRVVQVPADRVTRLSAELEPLGSR